MEEISQRPGPWTADREAGARPAAPEPVAHWVQIPRGRMDVDAIKVIRRLNRNGHTAYLVGGSVRDLLLDRIPKDFDVATSARPPAVRRLFRNCRLIGRRFRLAHILFANDKIIEVATFRRDPNEEESLNDPFWKGATGPDAEREPLAAEASADSKEEEVDLLIRRDNVYGDAHEDAIRRDFTINGLFYDVERQQVIDYVNGLADLRKGIIRTIGKAEVRFREDPARILRAIKFSARLDMGIAPEVYDAMVALVKDLPRSAPARLLEETLRLLRGGAAHRSIYLAWDVGALGVLFPELTAFLEDQADGADLLWARLSAIDRAYREQKLPGDAVLLAALLFEPMSEAALGADDPSAASAEALEQLSTRLAVPRKMKERIHKIFNLLPRLRQGHLSGLTGGDMLTDAVALLELQCSAESSEIPPWLARRRKLQRYRGHRRPRDSQI